MVRRMLETQIAHHGICCTIRLKVAVHWVHSDDLMLMVAPGALLV